MKILKNLVFGVFLLILEISMFQISLELGISSLLLVSAILCIWMVLKKITTVVVPQELVLSSEPFRDSGASGKKEMISANQKASETENAIPGVDGTIFEQFRKNLNLNPIPNSSSETIPYPENSANPDFVTDAYQKAGSSSGPENFSEELDEVEQVKVTLSANAKTLQEEQNEEITAVKTDDETEKIAEKKAEKDAEKEEVPNAEKTDSDRKLGAGEEALELLSRKHDALRRQTARNSMEQFGDFDDDLFADELIPLPGGENYAETENEMFSDEDPFANLTESYSLEDEEKLDSSLFNSTTHDEKNSEAEALLKLATTACEAGKMEEAKASLESYLELLNELGKNPSQDVLHLAEKLDITIDSSPNKKTDANNFATETEKKQETILKDVPEQTNYANVMDGIVKSLEKKEAYEEALPLLKDLLNYNRQRVNISAMDPLYDRIEQAYSSMKNDEDLVATYKEHLAIKQQLDDLEGELHLLDLISYYYANTGDQKASERYQLESKQIKDSLDYKMSLEK
jgi:hypothetical protein